MKTFGVHLLKILLLLAALPAALPAYAQAPLDCDYTVRGSIREQGSVSPVLGATVYIPELGRGAVADPEGEYVIDDLCAGDYTLVCQHLGYHTDTIRIHVHEGFVQCNFHLEEADIHLDAVVVSGSREKEAAVSTQATVQLQGAELARTRGLTLGESLKNLTGLSSIQSGPAISKPVIHGLHSSRILMLNNGIRQEGQQWGSEHGPEIDPFIATKVTVIKGSAAVRYGADAVGGVILVEPPPLPVSAGTRGEVNTVAYTNGWGGIFSGQAEGGSRRLEGLGWRLQGTVKRAGDARAADYQLSNTGVSELNFSGALGYRKNHWGGEVFFSRFHTNIGILRSAHIGGKTDYDEALARERPFYIWDFSYRIRNPRQLINHNLLKGSVYRLFPRLGTVRLQYGGQLNQRQEYDIRRGGRSNTPAMDLQLFTHTLDGILEHTPTGNFSGSVGLSTLYQDNENIPGTGTRPFIPNYTALFVGGFAAEKWKKDKWELEAGVRYEYRSLHVKRRDRQNVLLKPQYDFHNAVVTVGAAYAFNDRLTFKSNLGTAWRPPQVNELFSEGVHHSVGALEIGNDSLQTEKSLKWINTLSYSGKRLSFEGSVYYNRINDYIYLEPGGEPQATIRGYFPVFNYTQTDTRFLGTDLALQYQVSDGLSFRSKATLIRARDVTRNDYLIFIPPDRFDNSLTYSVEKWKKFSDLYLTLGVTHTRRQNRAPAERDYAEPPEGYMLVNAEAGFAVPVADNQLSVGLTVNNALDQSYRDYMNRLRYFADDLGRNVMLRLRYVFD